MSDSTEPAPLNQREMNQFIALATLPTLERALERLRWLEAQNAALKAHDPLAEMWREFAEYQPQADRDGHGESWAKMCSERTQAAACNARWAAARAASWDAWAAAWSVSYAVREAAQISTWAAIDAISRAKGER